MRRAFITIVVGIVGGGLGTPGLSADNDRPDPRAARVRHLIEMLASKNPEPVIRGDRFRGDAQTVVFSRSYNPALQVPVRRATEQLLGESEAALDLLLAHQGDQRYSFSIRVGEHDFNVSVSGACRMIASRIILAFNPELHFITRDQGGIYPSDKSRFTLAKWWEQRRPRGLAGLQIEAIDTMIAFMKQVDGETALSVHPCAERYPIGEFNRLREENLAILKSIRRKIAVERKPYVAKTLDSDFRRMIGLP